VHELPTGTFLGGVGFLKSFVFSLQSVHGIGC
jgi:hypothetical protein